MNKNHICALLFRGKFKIPSHIWPISAYYYAGIFPPWMTTSVNCSKLC